MASEYKRSAAYEFTGEGLWPLVVFGTVISNGIRKTVYLASGDFVTLRDDHDALSGHRFSTMLSSDGKPMRAAQLTGLPDFIHRVNVPQARPTSLEVERAREETLTVNQRIAKAVRHHVATRKGK